MAMPMEMTSLESLSWLGESIQLGADSWEFELNWGVSDTTVVVAWNLLEQWVRLKVDSQCLKLDMFRECVSQISIDEGGEGFVVRVHFDHNGISSLLRLEADRDVTVNDQMLRR